MATIGPRPTLSPSPHGSFGTPSVSRPIGTRVSKILASSFTSDTALIKALETISAFNLNITTGGNNLRRDVEKLMTDGSNQFFQAFGQVEARLEELQAHLSSMHGCCDEIDEQLQKANKGTRYLLEHAEGLREQRTTTALRMTLIQTFLARFTLSPAETDALTSRDSGDVGPALFQAMDKVQNIRLDCRALLSGDTFVATGDADQEQTKAGLSIMSTTSQYLDSGYAKMTKWAAFQVRGMAGAKEDQPAQMALEQAALESGVSDTMRECIRRLKARPDMLRDVCDLLASSRSSALLSLFLTALTRGGPAPSYLPRPIEIHAHDPLRYVGDMLAWIHQAMAGEREFLESLFGLKDERMVGSVRPALAAKSLDETEDVLVVSDRSDEARIRSLLDRNLEGCGRPLKIRVSQTIKSQEGSLLAYKLSQLIAFYKVTLEATVGPEAGLCKVLTELETQSRQAFFETLEVQGRALLRFIQAPASDLSPPLMLRDTLTTLRDLMTVHASSLSDGAEMTEAQFDDVLEASLSPALSMCERMGEMRPALWDRSIFAINCIAFAQAVLEPFAGFTATRLKSLDGDVRKHMDTLTTEHYGHLLKNTGLIAFISAIDERKDDTPLSHVPATSSRILIAAIKDFDTFLSTTDVMSSPRLALLTSPRLASAVHRAALGRITNDYSRLYDCVMNEEERYEFRSTVMRRSKDEVQTLLGNGIEGLSPS